MANQPDPCNRIASVTLKQEYDLAHLRNQNAKISSETSDLIKQGERLLRQVGVKIPDRTHEVVAKPAFIGPAELRLWEAIESDACQIDADVDALFSNEERSLLLARLHAAGKASLTTTRMDLADCAVAGMAAASAGIVDVLLVQVPRHPGFLGSPAHEGGYLSNVVKEKFGELFPLKLIRRLEREYPVPFDPSTNGKLDISVKGLGPRTHRFQSLGHDPLLAWIFGVSDVLHGTFTAVDKFGHLVRQSNPGVGTIEPEVGLFEAVLDAFRNVLGHLLSDVATPAGLPAPLMPLLLFVQTGSIGPHGYTIAEVARQMYRAGFDFRHFLAGSISTVLVEIIVRGAWVIRRLHEGLKIAELVPDAKHPRLRKTLLLAHSGAAAINAGKIYFTGPLGLNWGQWLTLSRYAARQTVALITDENGNRCHAAVDRVLADDWTMLSQQIHATWTASAGTIETTRI